MRVYLLRHGESEANVAGVINNDPSRPVDLTPRGRAQAEAAARRLAGVAFTAAYSSGFPRARQTAEILLAGLRLSGRLQLRLDARLNERRSGLDGRPVEAFNGLVRPDPVHIRPPAGESFLDQMERLRGFLDDLADALSAGPVLAVSHENPILAATALAGRDPEAAARAGLGNADWVVVDWPPDDGPGPAAG
jgi:broad specificity phosphatase PhoE